MSSLARSWIALVCWLPLLWAGCRDSSKPNPSASGAAHTDDSAAESGRKPGSKPVPGAEPAASADTLTPSQADTPELDRGLAKLLRRERLASIAVAIIRDRQLLVARGYGLADRSAGTRADADTIYLLASCSKPIVGLLMSMLAHGPDPVLDLNRDVDEYLQWRPRLAHPDFPDIAVTSLHLAHHRSGLAGDAPFSYESYPKPDPDQSLERFLRRYALDSDFWLEHAPGERSEYSNLGAALAGLVVEKAAGRPFHEVSNRRLFQPLGMTDTRWLYRELSAAQRTRLARPYDQDHQAYEHYGFNDYPSGLLRASVRDLSRLLIAIMNRGMHRGQRVMTEAAIDGFHQQRLFLEAEDEDGVMVYSHDGSESGAATHFSYSAEGDGIVYLINSDVPERRLDAVQHELERLLVAELQRE